MVSNSCVARVALLLACVLLAISLGSAELLETSTRSFREATRRELAAADNTTRNRPEFPDSASEIKDALLNALVKAKRLYDDSEKGMQVGVGVAVDIGGEITVQVGHGQARRAEDNDGKPMKVNEHTRFFFGSNTKTVTAALTMKYLQEEMISLDDDLKDYLSNELTSRYKYPGDITLTDLLRHTSGLKEYLSFSDVNVTNVWTMEELALHGPAGNEAKPPTAYEYRNTNYLLLGLICRILAEERDTVVLEQPLYEDLVGEFGESAEALQSWEFPLEFHWSYESASNAYEETEDGDIVNINSPPNSKFSPSLPSSAGNILSRPYDMVKFYHRLFGARDLISSENVDMMIDFGEDGTKYGFGVVSFNSVLDRDYLSAINITAYGHDGKWLAWESYCLYIPELDVSFAFASNVEEYNSLTVAMSTLDFFLEAFEAGSDSSSSSLHPWWW
ncbi:hypothetical protein QOT17_019619 [Balamuthia mandrillaris]